MHCWLWCVSRTQCCLAPPSFGLMFWMMSPHCNCLSQSGNAPADCCCSCAEFDCSHQNVSYLYSASAFWCLWLVLTTELQVLLPIWIAPQNADCRHWLHSSRGSWKHRAQHHGMGLHAHFYCGCWSSTQLRLLLAGAGCTAQDGADSTQSWRGIAW